MKTLFLLRHAKSSSGNPDLKDFERPLNERGLADVPFMAERFLERGGRVSCIICSPATRTKTTASMFSNSINLKPDNLASNPELYFAGSAMFLKAASLIDESANEAMLVGHNPAITEFVNCLADVRIDNIPTCGLAEIQLPIEHWSDIEFGSGVLSHFDYPKKDLYK